MESVFFEEAAAEELINKLLEEDRKSRKEEQKRQEEEEEEVGTKEMEEDEDDEGEERLETMVDDHDKLDFEVEEEMAEKTGWTENYFFANFFCWTFHSPIINRCILTIDTNMAANDQFIFGNNVQRTNARAL